MLKTIVPLENSIGSLQRRLNLRSITGCKSNKRTCTETVKPKPWIVIVPESRIIYLPTWSCNTEKHIFLNTYLFTKCFGSSLRQTGSGIDSSEKPEPDPSFLKIIQNWNSLADTSPMPYKYLFPDYPLQSQSNI